MRRIAPVEAHVVSANIEALGQVMRDRRADEPEASKTRLTGELVIQAAAGAPTKTRGIESLAKRARVAETVVVEIVEHHDDFAIRIRFASVRAQEAEFAETV